jgi:hypothetical protein
MRQMRCAREHIGETQYQRELKICLQGKYCAAAPVGLSAKLGEACSRDRESVQADLLGPVDLPPGVHPALRRGVRALSAR